MKNIKNASCDYGKDVNINLRNNSLSNNINIPNNTNPPPERKTQPPDLQPSTKTKLGQKPQLGINNALWDSGLYFTASGGFTE